MTTSVSLGGVYIISPHTLLVKQSIGILALTRLDFLYTLLSMVGIIPLNMGSTANTKGLSRYHLPMVGHTINGKGERGGEKRGDSKVASEATCNIICFCTLFCVA